MHVVLPAGNSYDARCHAVLDLAPDHPRQTLQWNVLPDDATPSFVELWLPDPHVAAQIKVKVSDPSGRSSDWCSVDEEFPPRGMPPSQVDFALIFQGSVADSLQGTMILVALAATAAGSPGAARANAGLWCIELSYAGEDPPVEVHAWIERDDTLPGRPQRGRQSYFVDTGGKQVRADGSFNSIANGLRTVVVGGYVGSTGDVASYSGGGPTRRQGCAAAHAAGAQRESPTLHGLLAAARRRRPRANERHQCGGTAGHAEVAQILSRCGAVPPGLTPNMPRCVSPNAGVPPPASPGCRAQNATASGAGRPAGGRSPARRRAAAAMPVPGAR